MLFLEDNWRTFITYHRDDVSRLYITVVISVSPKLLKTYINEDITFQFTFITIQITKWCHSALFNNFLNNG